MYSEDISRRDIAAVEDALGRTLDWWPVDECIDANAAIREAFAPDGTQLRALTDAEQRFIHDERLRCQFDAMYWLARYAWVRRDDVRGGEGIIELWESQKLVLKHIAQAEDDMWASYHRQLAAGLDESMIRVDGICIALLKARQLGACLPAGTRVLTADMRWVPIELIRVGDRLVSVDEHTAGLGKGRSRQMHSAVVEGTATYTSDTLTMTLTDGRQVTGSDNHKFLCKARGSHGAEWRRLDEMRPGDQIRHLVTPPEYGDVPSFEDGWFAGLLDGEGSLRAKRNGGVELSVSQVEGDVLDRAASWLSERKHSYRREVDSRKGSETSKLGNKPVHKFVLNRFGEVLEVITRTRPSRFVNRTNWWEGKELPNGDSKNDTWVTVQSISDGGRQRVYDLQTSTKTFIAEGLVTHNTALILLLLLHRFIFWTNLREVFASADETKTLEAFDLYFLFAYQRLPVWMRPKVETKSKDFGMRCESLDTTLFLQNAAQESGIGMGGTSHCGLITEVGLYPKNVIEQMQNHFFRSIPWSLVTFIVLESLAQGQGNFWHSFSLAAIRGGENAGRWRGVFIPWYIEPRKYRREPPQGWRPSPETMRYAYRVFITSEKYTGRQIELDEYQLYWYESDRSKAEDDGALEDFLTNYPATPEEAFQSKSGAPFSAPVLERLSNDCRDPIKQFEWLAGTGAGERGMRPADTSINPDDPRGIIRIYKKPDRSKRYKMGVDTAPGIPGWTRRLVGANDRGYGDRSKDNAAIEIIEVGQRGEPDEQVAEFIAPIDYVSLAPIVNWMGRLFRGRDEEMCECVVETGPTSGEALQERLLNEYGYWNLYRKANMATYSYSTSFGWVPTEKTRLDLWYRTRPHISYLKIIKVNDAEIRKVKFIARSRYLVDIEFRNCEVDKRLMTAKASFGFHDDATRAIQMAIYIAHDWQALGDAMSESIMGEVPREKRPDYQASDMTREEMMADVDARLEPEFGGEVW